MGIAELLKVVFNNIFLYVYYYDKFSMQILSMVNIDPLRKKPFVRFLLWVYMTTGGDKIQTGSTILHHDEYVYYLSKNVVFNTCLCELLQTNVELFGTNTFTIG